MHIRIRPIFPIHLTTALTVRQAKSSPQKKGEPDAANQRLRVELERANQKIRELEAIASKQVLVVPMPDPVTPPPKIAQTPPSITPTPSSGTPTPSSTPSSTTPTPAVTLPAPPVANTCPPQQPAQVEKVAPKTAAAAVPANGGGQPGQEDAIVTPVGNKATCHRISLPILTIVVYRYDLE